MRTSSTDSTGERLLSPRDVVTRAISASDLDLLKVTDDLDDAMRHLEAHAVKAFGLRRVQWQRPAWWLGEQPVRSGRS
jgi:hypothetical protein